MVGVTFPFRINPAQAEQLATLTKAFGAAKVYPYQSDGPGPLLFTPKADEDGLLVLTNGDLVRAGDFGEVTLP